MTIPSKTQFLAAYDLVSNSDTWTKGVWARDKDGKTVSYTEPTAVCFCSLGAMAKAGWLNSATWRGLSAETVMMFDAQAHDIKVGKPRTNIDLIGIYNDASEHAEVVAWWERVGKAWGYLQ